MLAAEALRAGSVTRPEPGQPSRSRSREPTGDLGVRLLLSLRVRVEQSAGVLCSMCVAGLLLAPAAAGRALGSVFCVQLICGVYPPAVFALLASVCSRASASSPFPCGWLCSRKTQSPVSTVITHI